MGADNLGGMADDARLIFASYNSASSCWGSAPDAFAGATNWLLANGARVINGSFGGSSGTPQDITDRFMDYKATHSPYPLFVTAAGNGGVNAVVSNATYNGLVVGGTNNAGTRGTEVMYSGSQAKNWAPTGGDPGYRWELPHIVAPAQNVSTAAYKAYDPPAVVTGTSFAAPQISGIAAALMEFNSAATTRPELIMSAILAGADENVDEAYGGQWPLELETGFDDKDGAGLVNAFVSAIVIDPARKVNGGNSAIQWGHDYGTMYASSTPAGTFYSEVYSVSVPAGATLRVVTVLTTTVTCGAPPSGSNCTSAAVPKPWLHVYDGGVQVAACTQTEQNYAITSEQNLSGSPKTYTVKIKPQSWSGASQAHFAIGWAS
jgi:hypothetical protein